MKALRRVLLVILLAAVSSARGQQPARLTLQAAFSLAEKQNLDLAAARQRRAVALAGVRIAGQRPNPSVTVGASRDLPHESVVVDQPFELGFKRQRRIEVAKQEGALTDVEISAVARQVRRNVREVFYAAVFARAESSRQGTVLKLAQRLKQIAQDRFEAGAVPQLEAIQAELEVSRAQANLEVAQQREKVSLSQLNALLNEPATTPWELAGSLEDFPPKTALPDLIQRAYASNTELQHLAQEQQIARRRRESLKADRIPNLDVAVGSDLNAPPDFNVGPRGQVSVMLPIFARNQGQIAQSIANERLLDAEAGAAKRAVAGRIEAAFFDLSARQAQVDLYRQNLLPAARKLEGMAEESYRAGKSNILTVLDAQRNVQQTEKDYLDGLLAVQSAFAGLEDTVGVPLE